MNKYFVQSFHTVYVDNYEQGEQEQVNYWKCEKLISSESPINALRKYYETETAKDFSLDNLFINDEIIHDSFLVDVDNYPATEKQIEQWKNNEINLYSENVTFHIFELKTVSIN